MNLRPSSESSGEVFLRPYNDIPIAQVVPSVVSIFVPFNDIPVAQVVPSVVSIFVPFNDIPVTQVVPSVVSIFALLTISPSLMVCRR